MIMVKKKFLVNLLNSLIYECISNRIDKEDNYYNLKLCLDNILTSLKIDDDYKIVWDDQMPKIISK